MEGGGGVRGIRDDQPGGPKCVPDQGGGRGAWIHQRVRWGLCQQPHTEKCRRRFVDLMKIDARFKTAEKRKQQYDDHSEKARQ